MSKVEKQAKAKADPRKYHVLLSISELRSILERSDADYVRRVSTFFSTKINRRLTDIVSALSADMNSLHMKVMAIGNAAALPYCDRKFYFEQKEAFTR